MKKTNPGLKQDCIKAWEQLVHAYLRYKDDPSVQCAWEIIKILLKILIWIIELRLNQ